MRIRINLLVEVDAALWAEYNGLPVSDVRADVLSHVLNHVQQSEIIKESDGTARLVKR